MKGNTVCDNKWSLGCQQSVHKSKLSICFDKRRRYMMTLASHSTVCLVDICDTPFTQSYFAIGTLNWKAAHVWIIPTSCLLSVSISVCCIQIFNFTYKWSLMLLNDSKWSRTIVKLLPLMSQPRPTSAPVCVSYFLSRRRCVTVGLCCVFGGDVFVAGFISIVGVCGRVHLCVVFSQALSTILTSLVRNIFHVLCCFMLILEGRILQTKCLIILLNMIFNMDQTTQYCVQ